MKKLLIMGGSYFIGKHVVNQVKNRFDTYVLNRGKKPLNDDLVKELYADRNDLGQMKSVLLNHQFDYMIDISAINQSQLEILFQSTDLSGVRRFIFISSSAVYNIKELKIPFKETDALGGETPFKSYAHHKIEAENFLSQNLDESQLIIFRPPIVYGEDNYVLRERLIFHLIEQHHPIYVPKTNNTIQFVYAKDLAVQIHEALTEIMPPGIYNVGDSQGVSFYHWIHLIEKVMGMRAEVIFVDHQNLKIDIRSFFPFFDYDNVLDVSKIKTYSQVETPMLIGLKNAYQDYQQLKEPIVLPDALIEGLTKVRELLQD
jgi:nucleoside-diphosphate-sugar epimerase